MKAAASNEKGTMIPDAELLYACDKCGGEPEDPKNLHKFCPECSDRFTGKDVK